MLISSYHKKDGQRTTLSLGNDNQSQLVIKERKRLINKAKINIWMNLEKNPNPPMVDDG